MWRTFDESIRELDQRVIDGIEVRLLWNARTDRVLLSVVDDRSGEAFELEVKAADALDAFRHPFAYLAVDDGHEALAA